MYILIYVIPIVSFLTIVIWGRQIGIKGLKVVTRIKNISLITLVSSMLYDVVYNKIIIIMRLGNYISNTEFNLNYEIRQDSSNIFIVFLIILIYVIVLEYSLWYMKEDPYIMRFISYMNIFCLMMLILVIGNNIIILFIGWEGVGITSYFLINFWYTRIQANKASIKAVILNKIGDIGLLIAILGLVYLWGSKSLEINNTVWYGSIIGEEGWMNSEEKGISTIEIWIIIGLIIGTIAKSAQIGLHNWLTDAMEGPTPVSALLHAATMVTAGIYLMLIYYPKIISYLWVGELEEISYTGITNNIEINNKEIWMDWLMRMDTKIENGNKIIENRGEIETKGIITNLLNEININRYKIEMSKIITEGIKIISLLTITIGAIAAYGQTDIKKIIALSTMSQLAYMWIGIIMGWYTISYYHLIIHGFFKALLFMSAGILIHCFNKWNEQDIRKLNNLIYTFPFTYLSFLIGTLSIVAFPFYSGYYSKDFLIEASLLSVLSIYIMTIIGAFGTMSYSIKLILKIFYSLPIPKVIDKSKKGITSNKEYKYYINIILFIGSLFIGYYTKDWFNITNSNMSIIQLNSYNYFDLEFISSIKYYQYLSLILNILALSLVFILINKEIYLLGKRQYKELKRNIIVENMLNKILYFDYIYNELTKRYLNKINRLSYYIIDKGYLEYILSIGIYKRIKSHINIIELEKNRRDNNKEEWKLLNSLETRKLWERDIEKIEIKTRYNNNIKDFTYNISYFYIALIISIILIYF